MTGFGYNGVGTTLTTQPLHSHVVRMFVNTICIPLQFEPNSSMINKFVNSLFIDFCNNDHSIDRSLYKLGLYIAK